MELQSSPKQAGEGWTLSEMREEKIPEEEEGQEEEGTTLEIDKIKIEFFSPMEWAHAIGIDTNGLPVFQGKKVTRTHGLGGVKVASGRMHLYCAGCKEYLPYGAFDYTKTCRRFKSARCIKCSIADERPTQQREFIPRAYAMSNKGRLFVYCRVCGRYMPADAVNSRTHWGGRRLCPGCQSRYGNGGGGGGDGQIRKKKNSVFRDENVCVDCKMFKGYKLCRGKR